MHNEASKILSLLQAVNPETVKLGMELAKSMDLEKELLKLAFLEDSFVKVEGGSFMMGSEDGELDEKPVREVILDSFFIGRHMLTVWQWNLVMKIEHSYTPDIPNCPMSKVNWNDALRFLEKLNFLSKNILKNGKTYRLPTEAEWEYAARGGQQSRGYKYAGSDDIDEVAWYMGSGLIHPVGLKKANELGLYDMSGNLWEWCSDWYGPYPYSRGVNPNLYGQGSYIGPGRVLRGGSYVDSAKDCRISKRYYAKRPDFRHNYGLRLVMG
jgi:formylglycine-generating enzyme required for sulfatase activity